ncbi:uncharacterized protein LOC114206651 [Eumetopias jubatus]|uniref:uncharacterized protein LOC114206651 n=1 Tax=Eumetopias jubatus TaxID=34886 RepID=UPI001015FA3E|nr:uncharacterized protein LOC114206651 [Eumetopias jubatus]
MKILLAATSDPPAVSGGERAVCVSKRGDRGAFVGGCSPVLDGEIRDRGHGSKLMGVTGYSMFRSRLIADPYRTVAKTSLRRAVITLAANRGCSFTHRLLEKMAVGHEQEKCSSMPKFAGGGAARCCYHCFPGPFLPTSSHGMLLSFTAVSSRFLLSNVADERSGKSTVFHPNPYSLPVYR